MVLKIVKVTAVQVRMKKIHNSFNRKKNEVEVSFGLFTSQGGVNERNRKGFDYFSCNFQMLLQMIQVTVRLMLKNLKQKLPKRKLYLQ